MIIALQTLLFFRESIIALIERLFRPYYTKIKLQIKGNESSDDEDSDDHVFSEYDEEKGVIFYPPVYAQRYAAVSDCLMDESWSGKLKKVVDFGYHDMSFIKYLIDVPGIKHILGVDIDSIPLRCSSDLEYETCAPKRDNPLQITLFQGNAADPDFRLIGCDAVVAIEMIEHMLPHDLERLVHTVFGFIKPQLVIFTTPNGDFNVLFKALERNGLRRTDHFFEWSREQFHDWCSNIVLRYPQYTVTTKGIGPGPPGTSHFGCCSQLAMFVAKNYHKQDDLDVNSLALVPKVPIQSTLSDMVCSCNSSEDFDNKMLCVEDKLNCSTLQVKKFSKVTQNLLAKNKVDEFGHTREVIDEINYLTKMLNFNKDSNHELENHTWCNINWGENAPYWNQYYKVVREYNYPYDTKPDDCRILDLISEEINRLLDGEKNEAYQVDGHKLEVPVEYLMHVVRHITSDVDKVKDLLEWNGYEIVDDVLVHTRLDVDNISLDTDNDWNEDGVHDWDTIDRITPNSECSDVTSDIYDRSLHRALDRKICKLRSMFIADEDVTSELDQIVCRLVKLALNSSRGRLTPPSVIWMQYKLFDLLSLTEKAIERRRCHLLDTLSLKAIEYCKEDRVSDIILTLNKITEDDKSTDNLVFKYYQLVPSLDNLTELDENQCQELHYEFEDSDFDDITSNEFKGHEVPMSADSQIVPAHLFQNKVGNKFEAISDWDSNNMDLVPYLSRTDISDVISTDENNFSVSNSTKYDGIKTNSIFKYLTYLNSNSCLKLSVASQNKVLSDKMIKTNCKTVNRNVPSKTKVKKNDKNTNSKYLKRQKRSRNMIKGKKKSPGIKINESKISKPIPESFKTICYPDLEMNWEENNSDIAVDTSIGSVPVIDSNIANTEICVCLNIVSEFGEETIALQRNIGTDPDSDMLYFENEILLDSFMNVTRDNSFYFTKVESDIENIDSNTIFLNDINEPSTSKGIRHLSTDVQCGPDVSITNVMLSASTSLTKMSKLYKTGIKIGDSCIDIPVTKVTYDFGTCTENYDSMTTSRKSIGIKIKDSVDNICKHENCTMTEKVENSEDIVFPPQDTKIIEPKLLKSERMSITDEFSSDIFESTGSVTKSPTRLSESSRYTSDFHIQLIEEDNNTSKTKYVRPKLSCGGVHVHSFKDRIVSEDLVYQGEWQRSKLKTLAKKLPVEPSIKKIKNREIKKNFTSKDYTSLKGAAIKENKVLNKTITVRSPKDPKKCLPKKAETKKSVSSNSSSLMKTNRNVMKVASKITMSSTVSKNTKHIFSAKRPFVSSTPNRNINTNLEKQTSPKKNFEKQTTPKKNLEKQTATLRKNYLPLYLRKRLNASLLNEQSDKFYSKNVAAKQKVEKNTAYHVPHVKKLTDDLLSMSERPHTNLDYIVFRNEIETNKSISTHSPSADLGKNDSFKRVSPGSPNSSACSSPNSIETVRAASTKTKCISNRKNSTSSDKSTSGNVDSDGKSLKNKKYSRRVKTIKKPPNIIPLSDNKENLPESSRNAISSKDIEINSKKVFLSSTKSIYMAQMTTATSNLGLAPANSKSKTHSNKPLKYLSICSPDIQKFSSSIPSVSTKKSCNDNLTEENQLQYQLPSIDDLSVQSCVSAASPIETNDRLGNVQIVTESTHISDPCSKSVHQTKSSILSAIRQLVECNLNKVETKDNDGRLSDSETVIISRNDLQIKSFDDIPSPISIKTMSRNEGIYKNSDRDKINVITNPMVANSMESEHSGDSVSPDTELDLSSFKSMVSMANSKLSEYYLADNELDTVNTTSVQGLFERKETNMTSSTAGVLAIQAFSGFSMNLEPLSGDQPDHINLIDSETGSLALDSARQTASEELFVSGRSSDTYESCLYDDDTDVPHWLFNIISHQQSIEESETEDTLPVMVPLTDQEYDINGNVEPGVGVGAGAGDGRGIHSDHSQDSSGRGTSLSSTPTSSGPQSEVAVLIDSSAFTAQSAYGPLMPTNTQNGGISASVQLTESNRTEGLNRTHTNTRGFINPVLVTSDVDADVSSLDTDAMDSDN